MNDHAMITAIRKLPARYITPGVNVTRFGATFVACHPEHEPIQFSEGKWIKVSMRDRRSK